MALTIGEARMAQVERAREALSKFEETLDAMLVQGLRGRFSLPAQAHFDDSCTLVGDVVIEFVEHYRSKGWYVKVFERNTALLILEHEPEPPTPKPKSWWGQVWEAFQD